MPISPKSIRRPWMPAKVSHSGRKRPNNKFYHSTAWRKLRAVFITEHPLCAECERQGRYTPATVVDHITPINQGGEPLDETNLQSLCERCHNQKSGREARG